MKYDIQINWEAVYWLEAQYEQKLTTICTAGWPREEWCRPIFDIKDDGDEGF